MTGTDVLVHHHPADHPYVRHLGLDDRARPSLDVWDVGALRRAAVRIVHLHFGYEQRPEHRLLGWLGELKVAGIGLVHTVHDVDNPHLTDQRPHHRLQAHVVDAADHVVTLTPAAAAAIRRRYGRDAEVLAHPHVVPLAEIDRRRATPTARSGVYVHAATLRPNLDHGLLRALAAAADAHGGLRIHVRRTTTAARRRRLWAAVRGTGVRMDVEHELTDDELWARLATAAVVALPYRWGTHSGLLEAAHDLGTAVVAPEIGGLLDQGAIRLDPSDVAAGLAIAAARPPLLDAASRRRDRMGLAARHRQIYADVLRRGRRQR